MSSDENNFVDGIFVIEGDEPDPLLPVRVSVEELQNLGNISKLSEIFPAITLIKIRDNFGPTYLKSSSEMEWSRPPVPLLNVKLFGAPMKIFLADKLSVILSSTRLALFVTSWDSSRLWGRAAWTASTLKD